MLLSLESLRARMRLTFTSFISSDDGVSEVCVCGGGSWQKSQELELGLKKSENRYWWDQESPAMTLARYVSL